VTTAGWVRAPTFRRPDREAAERRTTWLELFFDLVFAAAVADIGAELSDDYTLSGLGHFSFQFFLLWWAWTGHTFFSTRFDNDDVLQRVITLAQVFLAAVMSINASTDLSSRETAGFVAGYGGIRLLLAMQYARVVGQPESSGFARSQSALTAAAAAIWIGSALSSEGVRPWLWAGALALDLLVPVVTRRASAALPIDPAHLRERFGLFTLILLGQSVVAIMAGMRQREVWTTGAAGSAVLGLALAFALWWAYFGAFTGVTARAARWTERSRVWIAAHLPLCFGIAVAAVGIEHIISGDGTAPLGDGVPLLLAGIITAVVSLGLLRMASTATKAPNIS
jgi:low temperature requirement protein LtrA